MGQDVPRENQLSIFAKAFLPPLICDKLNTLQGFELGLCTCQPLFLRHTTIILEPVQDIDRLFQNKRHPLQIVLTRHVIDVPNLVLAQILVEHTAQPFIIRGTFQWSCAFFLSAFGVLEPFPEIFVTRGGLHFISMASF